MSLPSLPQAGPLRGLALAGSVAIIAYATAAFLELKKSPRAGLLAGIPLVLALSTAVAGRYGPLAHHTLAALTLGATLAIAYRARGWSRGLEIAAGLAWIAALVFARALFS